MHPIRLKSQMLACLVASACFATTAQASLELSRKPTQNVTCSAGVCSATAKKAVLNVADLATMLGGGDVTVASASAALDIEIDDALSWTSPHRLTLNAWRAITFYKPVVVAGTGALAIATNDGGSGGDFRFLGKGHVEFWDTTSSLTINGQSYLLARNIKQIVAQRALQGPSYIALAKSFDAARQTYSASPVPSYAGTFEGLGNTISNLRITDSKDDCVGFFGCKDNGGGPTLRDLGLLSVDIRAVGGQQAVGALIGQSIDAAIIGSYATGQVSSTGAKSFVGGLVGIAIPSLIERAHAAVAISSTGDGSSVGGLVGQLFAICNSGCQGAVDQSFTTGSVTASGDYATVGGLAGFNVGGTITNSYATGPVTGGHSASAGGLIGWSQSNQAELATATLVSSYSLGQVSADAPSSYIGGVIGYNGIDMGDTVNIQDCWNTDTSGIANPAQGAGYPANDPGITGLTAAQLKSGLPAGFDKSIWAQKPGVNDGYPYLRALPPQ